MDIKFRSHILNSGTTFRSCIPARYKIQDGLEAPVTWQFCFPSLFFARFLCVCVCVCVCCVLVTQSQSDSTIPWTVAHQAPLSMEFSRQEYWNGLSWPSPGIFPTQGLNPGLPSCRQILYQLSHQGSPPRVLFFLITGLCVSVKSTDKIYGKVI